MSETSEWDHYDEYLWEEYRFLWLLSQENDYKIVAGLRGWNFGDLEQRKLTVTLGTPYNTRQAGATMVYNGKTGNFIERNPYSPEGNYLYDSLRINHRTYHNVIEAHFLGYGGEQHSILYYNKTHGVLLMKENGDTVFTLQEYIPAR